MSYIRDILTLLFSWKLAKVIRRLGMPQPGDTLLIADRFVLDHILKHGLRGAAPVPILFCQDVNNLRTISFEELCIATNWAWSNLQEGVRVRYCSDSLKPQSSGREKGWPEPLSN